MRVVMFCHSLISDWNHGNAHFLRGIVGELQARGHAVAVFEPRDAWSVQHLMSEHGDAPLEGFRAAYPLLSSVRYEPAKIDLERAVDGAELVLVHEWNDPSLVARLGELRRQSRAFRLLFHDTHHRSVTDERAMAAYDLRHYDGVLAFGAVIRDLYLRRGWTARAWVWHEAADVRLFRPRPEIPRDRDLVWVGNWGDDERAEELRAFLLGPVKALRLKALVHGVRYPAQALEALRSAGIQYSGWLPNFAVPEVFARHRVTVHVPRRPYARALPGIPTIRPFEAMACGIPLVSAPWEDAEGLFTPGKDFWVARDGQQMRGHLRTLLNEPEVAEALAGHGRRTLLARHTCAHRVEELLAILAGLGLPPGGGRNPIKETAALQATEEASA